MDEGGVEGAVTDGVAGVESGVEVRLHDGFALLGGDLIESDDRADHAHPLVGFIEDTKQCGAFDLEVDRRSFAFHLAAGDVGDDFAEFSAIHGWRCAFEFIGSDHDNGVFNAVGRG